jgi:glutathione S-transferase
MSKLKLTYFDIDAGRGEPARLALFLAGIPFIDDRIPISEWPKRKTGTPLHALPVLEADRSEFIQSNTINRYVGKLSGFYPTDAIEAARCDEIMDIVEDVTSKIGATFPLADEVRKMRREALVSGVIPLGLRLLESRLQAAGGRYFADDRLTVADFKVLVFMRLLQSGRLDHIPVDLPERFAPRLLEHRSRVEEDPAVTAYYANRAELRSAASSN